MRTRRIGADSDHRARERTGGGGPQTPTSAMTSTVTRQSLVASRRTDRPMARLSAVALAIVLVGAGAGHPAAGALLVVGGFPVGRVEHESRVADEAPGDAGAARPLARAATPAVGAAAGTEVLVGEDAGGGFVLHVSFDDSITNDPNAAAIESAVVDAARTYVSLLTDPITVSIRFRYATTRPDGTPLGTGLLAESQSCLYRISWASYVDALVADATTPNDTLATASLPAEPLSVQIYPTSANGRAVGLDLPPVMFADGNLGPGGPYDGIVTINALQPFSFTRPPAPQTYDAQRSIEHEIDEVLGLGSDVVVEGNLRPEALFGWSAPGVLNSMTSGTRYFSIDDGDTELVGFNQDPNGDAGDWLSAPCPQATPYVQNAFSCKEQFADVTPESPEGIALDVVGWDVASPTASSSTTTTPSTSTTTTTTAPACPPSEVECCPPGEPGCGVCGVDCGNGGCCPTTAPVCDNANRTCLSCGPAQVECCPPGEPGCGLCGTDCGNGSCCPSTAPVCDNGNGACLTLAPSAPECSPGQAPCSDSALGFSDVACCAVATTRRQCAAACSDLVAQCASTCAAAGQPRKCRKRCRAAIVGHCRKSRPHVCS